MDRNLGKGDLVNIKGNRLESARRDMSPGINTEAQL
jgi:hypothetical protein